MTDARQRVLAIQPEAPPRFENFLPGDNREPLQALQSLAGGDLAEVVLYLWGTTGSGRSHLLQATVAAATQSGRAAQYVAAGVDLPEVLSGLLAVDDVERLDDAGQVRLFSLINQAREGAGRVLAAGPAAPGHLTLRPDLATRLGWGLVFGLRPLAEAERAVALRERAAALGLDLGEDVVRYLLSHGRRDLPSLLASLDALDAYSLSLKRPVTVPLARAFLAGRATPDRE